MAMNGLPYYKRYPRDFLEGTVGMEFELKAAYALVLDLIYMQGGELRDDPRYISGLLGMSVRKWNRLREKLLELGKIYVENEFISNFRADKELETLRSFQTKQAENASGPRKNKDLPKPRLNHTEPEPEPDISSINRTNNIVALPTKKKDPPPDNEDPFDTFWTEYPRKEGKGKARAAFASALKRDATPEQILEGLQTFNAYHEAVGTEKKFICHPTTWLNGERWCDELEPPELTGQALIDKLKRDFLKEEETSHGNQS